MANGILVKLDVSQHASVFVLASLVLLIAQMPLLMGANIHCFFSAGCLGHLGTDLYTKGGCT